MTEPVPSSRKRPPWLWIVIGVIALAMAVTIAVLATLLVTGDDGGKDDASGSTSSTVSSTTTSAPTTAPTPTEQPSPPTAGTPSGPANALTAWVGDLGLTYFGDCDSVSVDVGGDGYCSLLQSDADGTRVYGLGPPFSEIVWWVRVQEQNDEWVVTAEADALENPAPPF